ncbi:hypothetical protein ACVWWK_000092 [Bradyrhizobium sp. LB9.1b]
MTGNERNAIETYECDVLVAGSGASGMSAAITARYRGLDVLIVEKEPRFGGTTARSGGWLWIPGTSLAKAYGIEETPEQARTYLRHEAGNNYDAARVDAFLSAGPEAVGFFTSKTALRFDMPLVFPDYHAEAPGGTQGGRSMVARPFDGRELGDQIKTLGMPLPELTVFGMMLGSGKDIVHFMRATKSLTSAVYVAKRLSRHLMDVLRYGRGMTLTNGNALAGRLAKSAQDLKIPMWLSSPVRELTVENGTVIGAIVAREGRDVRIRARQGVVLACGGFPHDVERRKKMFPHAPTGNEHFSPGPTGNTGDRPAPCGKRRRACRGPPAERGSLGPGLGHQAQGRFKRRDAAFHRPRKARCDRGDARRKALCQRGQFLSRLRPGHGQGGEARRGDRGVPRLRSPDPAQIRPRLRAALPDANRSSPQHGLSLARRDAGGACGKSGY